MPYKSDLDDQMAVFNQFSVLAMVYMQYLCTEYVTEPDFKINVAGNTMMVIFSVNIVVNIVIGFIEYFKPTILKFKRWMYQRKNKKTIQVQKKFKQTSSKDKVNGDHST